MTRTWRLRTEVIEVFDRETFLKKFNHHPKLIKVTISSFLSSWMENFSEIESAVEAASAESLRKSAHRLKGSIGYFGEVEAFNLTASLEEMGKSESLEGAGPCCQQLQSSLLALQAELQDLLQEYS